ncbi:hypothetical protein Goarm_008075, partial [Gossypium armourianum]|nr:hypothetical protein [Gossypium armourianum]
MDITLQYRKAPEGSAKKAEAQKQLVEIMSHRMHIDTGVKLIGNLLFGTEIGPDILIFCCLIFCILLLKKTLCSVRLR